MNMFFSVIRVALVLIVIVSCKKEKETEQPPPVQPVVEKGNASARIANKTWIATTAYARITDGKFMIHLSSTDGRSIDFTLKSTQQTQFTFNKFQTVNSVVYKSEDEKTYNSQVELEYSGELTVSAYNNFDQTLTGTFSVILANTKDQRLITIEDGRFDQIPVIDQPFPEIRVYGLYQANSLARVQFSDILINAFGKAEVKPLGKTFALTGYEAANYSVYTGTSGLYCFGDEKGNQFLSVNTSGNGELMNWFKPQAAPVLYNREVYAVAANGGDTAYVCRIDAGTGNTKDTLANFKGVSGALTSTRWSSAQDGSNVFFLTGTTLAKYQPANKSVSVYSLNPSFLSGLDYDGLEAVSGNELLAFKKYQNDSLALVKISVSTAFYPTITPLINFSVAGCAGCKYSSVYDSVKKVYFLFTYKFDDLSDDVTTTIRSFDLVTNKTAVITTTGNIFGVERQ
ncbi:MAG: DUF6252 family protein [Bacteroidota bacterium]